MTFRHCTTYLFLSTLSLRRATQAQSLKIAPLCISIHALLTESDIYQERQCEFYGHFYPRSPYGERPNLRQNQHRRKKFLSTLSLRRATWARGSRVTYVEFLSTLSLRRATFSKETPPHRTHISIHALLTESDKVSRSNQSIISYFYPRSPYGERLSTMIITICIVLFLSTLSLRRATVQIGCMSFLHSIFLSTLSLRRATYPIAILVSIIEISIHALLTESDL